MAKLELTKGEEDLLLQTSIERCINTSITLAEAGLKAEDFLTQDYASTNLQDWIELKALAVKLWNYARNEAFVARNVRGKGGPVSAKRGAS